MDPVQLDQGRQPRFVRREPSAAGPTSTGALGRDVRWGRTAASALRPRVAPVARPIRAGRAVLEGRALAADRSHPTQLGSGRSHAVD